MVSWPYHLPPYGGRGQHVVLSLPRYTYVVTRSYPYPHPYPLRVSAVFGTPFFLTNRPWFPSSDDSGQSDGVMVAQEILILLV